MEPRKALALLIEASRYEEPTLPALPAAESDTTELAEVLGDPVIGGYGVSILNNPASREAMDAIHDFLGNAQEGAQILLHLACHAVRDSKGNVYLAARDTDLSSVRETAISINQLIQSIQVNRATYVVVILDLCQSGAPYGERESRAIRRQQSRVAFFASSYGYDQVPGGHSPFTQAVVRCLRDPTADLNGDGRLDLRELHSYVARNAQSEAKRIVLAASSNPAGFFIASTRRTALIAKQREGSDATVLREIQASRRTIDGPSQPNPPIQSGGDEQETVYPLRAKMRSLWHSFIDGLASVFDPLGAIAEHAKERRILGWQRIKIDLSERYSRLSQSRRQNSEGVSEGPRSETEGDK